ncbi:hypothetical protein JT358_08025 [Micrococcales bacterium 31B]|nr:hypothetical protein [Micrococcales bacterium 31B]
MRGDVQSAEWRSLWLFARARRATGHVVAIMAVAILSTLISTVAVPAAQDFGDNLAYGYLYYP